MIVLCWKTLPQLWEIFLFIAEMNEPVMTIRGKINFSQLIIPIELRMSLELFLK